MPLICRKCMNRKQQEEASRVDALVALARARVTKLGVAHHKGVQAEKKALARLAELEKKALRW